MHYSILFLGQQLDFIFQKYVFFLQQLFKSMLKSCVIYLFVYNSTRSWPVFWNDGYIFCFTSVFNNN